MICLNLNVMTYDVTCRVIFDMHAYLETIAQVVEYRSKLDHLRLLVDLGILAVLSMYVLHFLHVRMFVCWDQADLAL